MEKTSFWFKRTIESLKHANKSLKFTSNNRKEPRLLRTTNLQKRVNIIISLSYRYDTGLTSSSLTPFAQISHPAVAYRLRSAKNSEEEDDDLPPRKRVALAKRTGHGALNKPKVDGMSLMHSFQQNERFRNLELPKLVEEEKTRATDDDDVDLTIDRTVDVQKVKLVARNRFRSLHHSGKIHIRDCKTDPSTLVNIICIIAVTLFEKCYICLFTRIHSVRREINQ